jgi:hypothetical protein
MSNQVKLFKEGHLPVFRNDEEGQWNRIKIPLQQNGVARSEEGYQLTFKHQITTKGKTYFAFSYPWTYSENNLFIRNIIDLHRERLFCEHKKLCLTSKRHELNILTITRVNSKNSLEILDIEGLEDMSIFTFARKKVKHVSFRVFSSAQECILER